jgi:hypothetical protein
MIGVSTRERAELATLGHRSRRRQNAQKLCSAIPITAVWEARASPSPTSTASATIEIFAADKIANVRELALLSPRATRRNSGRREGRS